MARLTIKSRLNTCVHGDLHTVALVGELDIGSAPLLERTLADLCSSGAKQITVDLAGVEFMDSSGMNAILRSRMLCEEHECDLSLTPARRSVRRVFEVARVLEKLPFRRGATNRAPADEPPEQAGQLEISDEERAGTHTLVLAGQLDTTTAAALERVMVALCKAGASEIVLDLRRLDQLDSAGVRAIVSGQERCREHDCEFFLTPGRQAIERLFDVIGLPHDMPAPEQRPSSAM
jgi:anti-sigma B factor antagonist